jgi:hypothetical protein
VVRVGINGIVEVADLRSYWDARVVKDEEKLVNAFETTEEAERCRQRLTVWL